MGDWSDFEDHVEDTKGDDSDLNAFNTRAEAKLAEKVGRDDSENPEADCGHKFLSEWNGSRNPFPLPCDFQDCRITRCWRCPPCHDKTGKRTL